MNIIKNKSGFTLVELIVVITILSILGTIAFLSFQGYPASARNSSRLSDLANIETSLRLYNIKTGNYPEVSNAFNITYSGAVAWTQGTFGETAFINVESLSQVPTDPLTENEYTYSTTNTRGEYQLASISEDAGLFSYVNGEVHAADQIARAVVVGDYNEKIIRVHTGTTDYILAVPSIITSEITDIEIENIITRKSLVLDGYNNAPSSYVSEYLGTGAVEFNESSPNNIVVYAGDVSDLSEVTQRLSLANELQQAYSGTLLASLDEYNELVSLSSDEQKIALITNYIAVNQAGLVVNGIDRSNIKSVSVQSSESSSTYIARLFKDINTNGSSGVVALIVLGTNLIFTADNGIVGLEPFKTNGTEPGTEIIKDIHLSAGSQSFIGYHIYDNILYFNANDGVDGNELWRTDGTNAGTYQVKDMNIGPGDGYAGGFFEFNSILYFAGTGTNGNELWRTDGTNIGTYQVKDINIGAGSSNPEWLTRFDDKIFFNGTSGVSPGGTGPELWVSDGTEIGTHIFKDINTVGIGSNPYGFTVFNNKLYFIANDGINGSELWISDGTVGGTTILKDINSIGSNGSSASGITVFKGKMYFTATDGLKGRELWESDGTSGGTVILKDIYVGPDGSDVANLTVVGDTMYFYARTLDDGMELWKTDGTKLGTELVKDINGGPSDSGLLNYSGVIDGKMYFAADDGINGTELWVTNGTELGTQLVKNINQQSSRRGVGGSSPRDFTLFSNKLYFTANDGLSGKELWVIEKE